MVSQKYFFLSEYDKVVMEDMVFYVNRKLASRELRESLIFLDEMIGEGHVIKDSRTTTAGIMELKNGERYFVKRENNKGMVFTLKYLFRHSRVFRAAASARRLEALGIPTPKVIAVGSRRRMGKLIGGYLITEALDNVLKNEAMCQKLLTDMEFYQEFLTAICKYMGELHNHGLAHGDLKLSNIFCQETVYGNDFGLWDLDGTRDMLPVLDGCCQEVARIISSLIRVAQDIHGDMPDSVELAGDFCGKYNIYAERKVDQGEVEKHIGVYLKRYRINV